MNKKKEKKNKIKTQVSWIIHDYDYDDDDNRSQMVNLLWLFHFISFFVLFFINMTNNESSSGLMMIVYH